MNPFLRAKQTIVAAAMTSDGNTETRSEFELLMVKLTRDKQTLSEIQGTPGKVAYKNEHFETYWPWCEGVLSQNEKREDPILINMFIWSFDIGDLEKAQQLSEYMLDHDIQLNKTNNFTITTAGFIARSIADLGQFPDLDFEALQPFFDLVKDKDMPNVVLANLYKTAGLLSKEESDFENSLAYFKRAEQLHRNIGVKKLSAEVEKLIAEQKAEENKD